MHRPRHFQGRNACRVHIGPRRGTANYTIKSWKDGKPVASVEIQLKNRKFYIKKTPQPLQVSPSVAWARFKSVQEAWEHTKTLVGGWDDTT